MKNLLIEGRPGVGKTSLLLKELKDYLPMAGGYRTIRLMNPDGGSGYIGFAHVSPDSDEGLDVIFREGREGLFLRVDSGKADFNMDEFRSFVIPSLAANDCAFYFIDEIGGGELNEKDIYDAYMNALKSDKPCIGILKVAEHARHFAYDAYVRFRKQMDDQTDTEVVTMTSENREEIADIIGEWIRENNIQKTGGEK